MPTVGSNWQLTPRRRSEQRVAAEFVAALANADAPVADVYRHFYHATMKPGFTHAVGTNAAVRLDRSYAATDLMPSLLSIDTAAPSGFSDHVAVTVALVSRSARPPPVNTWRADLACLSNKDRGESLEQDIVLLAHEALSRSNATLVSCWHSFKQEFVRLHRSAP
jgi:hypothetical protein